MSIQAMTWVWGLEGLDTSQTMVLLALADAANDDGFACWPSQETLARKSRMSVRSVKRHIATLRDAGLIDVEMQSSTRGRMANLYRLHVGAERDFSALSRQRVKLAPSNSASGEIVDIPAKGQIDPLRNDGSNEVPKGTPMTPTKGTRVSPCNIGTVIKNHQTKPNQTEPTHEEAPVGCEGEFFGSVGSGVEVEIDSPLGVADAELIAECLPPPLRVLDATGAVAVARLLRDCDALVASGDASLATSGRASSKAGQARVAGGVVSGQGNAPESRSERRLESFEGSGGADWAFLATVLPESWLAWLSGAGVRQLQRLAENACAGSGWTPSGLRDVLASNPLPPPSDVRNPTGFLIARVRDVLAVGKPPSASERRAEVQREKRVFLEDVASKRLALDWEVFKRVNAIAQRGYDDDPDLFDQVRQMADDWYAEQEKRA